MRSKLLITGLLLAVLASGCMPMLARQEAAESPAPPAQLQDEPPTPRPTPSLTPPPGPRPTATPFPEATLSPPPVDTLPNVSLDVELFYAERWMRVRQTVDLRNTSRDTWDSLVFNVPINFVPSAFFLDEVTVLQGESMEEVEPFFVTPETILRVSLPEPARPGDSLRVELRYRVVIPPVDSTTWPPVGTTGWRWNLIQAGEWYPALVPYFDGEGWATWYYRPVGDPTFYPLVNTDLVVRAPEGIIVAGSGPVDGIGGFPGLGEDGVWRFQQKAARGIAFLASPYYGVLTGEALGIPIHSYYLLDHAGAGQAALDIAAESLRLFVSLFGPYPYDSLTVAENAFFGGMEYSGLITVTDYAYAIYPGGAPSLLHALISHEVAHMWWYGAVGNNQVEEPWLDESLAFYSELLYFEHYYPDLTGWWWEKRVDQYNPQGPVDVNIYAYERSSNFMLLMYGQAARFIRDLRALMGDEAFFDFLKDYYATHQWQIVTAEDFFAAVRRHTDDDLGPLIERYFTEVER